MTVGERSSRKHGGATGLGVFYLSANKKDFSFDSINPAIRGNNRIMKNFCITFLIIVIISVTALGFSGAFGQASPTVGGEYLRIHIRADSNESAAQAVKYEVRDELVEYLTPLVATCENKQESVRCIEAALPELSAVATRILREKGFSYGATAKIAQESFPTRVYGEYVLPAGEYTALIVELGSGKGDNWWCVVYPPLCFTGSTTNVVYKSKIQEIINEFYHTP